MEPEALDYLTTLIKDPHMLQMERQRAVDLLFERTTPPNIYEYVGKVVPKQRPRKGKGGRMFTPPETREFERLVKEWGYDCGMTPVRYPIRATLTVYDETSEPDLVSHSVLGMVYYGKKDLDNIGKAVFDALNGVAYKDDKQLVDIRIKRRYKLHSGFRLVLERRGLSAMEYSNLKKRLR